MKKIILGALLVFLGAFSVFTVYKHDETTAKDPVSLSVSENKNSPKFNPSAVKIKAADFKLKDLEGKEISLKDLKGKKVFLNFWATWCPPCRQEMPELETLQAETKDNDVVILAINIAAQGDDLPTVKSFMAKNNYHFRVLMDSENTVSADYSISGIPTSYFIDTDGNISAKKVGAMSLEEMKAYIAQLK